MAMSRRLLGLRFLVVLASICGVTSRALPQGTVITSGEPSHFQVDDKAAEIEVNANPAGVKVIAKPASLQVVAKPGTPAIPVYHPAIHIAPHYLPPPIIHREPAMYFQHRHHCNPCCPPLCFGRSRGWFYSGLRRNTLPNRPNEIIQNSDTEDTTRDKSSQIPRPSDRDILGRELDEDGNIIGRNHKSSIPRPERGHKRRGSHKRQFIAGIPQSYQPQGISSLGASGYTMQPYNSMASTRAPLARDLLSAYNGGPSTGLGPYGSYGTNGLSSLYSQPLSNSGLGILSGLGQQTSNNLGMYAGYGPYQSQLNSLTSNTPNYGLRASTNTKSNLMNSFLQPEMNHEFYGSSATPSALGLGQGYGRSLMSSPYALQPTGYEGLMAPRSTGGMGGLFGGPLVSSGMNYQGAGLLGGYSNSALMQLAQLYATQLSAMTSGLQQYGQSRSAIPLFSYPYMGGRSPLIGRSNVPGSRKKKHKSKINRDKLEPKTRNQITNKEKGSKDDKKSRRKRQLFEQDLGGYNLDILQDALENEFKREIILGAPPQAPQIASLTDQQQSLGLPFPGIQQAYGANQGQTGNFMGLSQMAGLDGNYVAPLQRFNSGNLGNIMRSSQAMTSMALGRSQVSPDQLRIMPSLPEQMPMASSAPLVRRFPQQQGINQNRPQELVGLPMVFKADYKSPIQYEQERRPHYRRAYGRHPLFRRRLHHNYYDDDEYDDGDYRDDREMYHGQHLGRETVSLGGSYSENEMPNNEGETLVDTSNHGFGPITVEAKTAEGVRKSLGEDKRGNIAQETTKGQKRIDDKNNSIPVSSGVL